MLAPSIVIYLLFVAMPLVATIALSFFNWDLLSSPVFAGFANFAALAKDSTTLRSIGNTLFFAIITVIVHMVGAVLLAIAINRPMHWVIRKLMSAAIFFPVLISWAAVSLTWQYILDSNFGFVSYYLKQFGITAPGWFIDPHSALPTLIGLDVWHSLGYTMVIILTGLQGIPPTLYEAARIDGAGPLRQFWSITT